MAIRDDTNLSLQDAYTLGKISTNSFLLAFQISDHIIILYYEHVFHDVVVTVKTHNILTVQIYVKNFKLKLTEPDRSIQFQSPPWDTLHDTDNPSGFVLSCRTTVGFSSPNEMILRYMKTYIFIFKYLPEIISLYGSSSTQSSQADDWVHVALVYNGTDLTLYIDKEPASSRHLTGIDLPSDCLC